MRPRRLISLLVAVCMMITMLPLSAVTAFAEDTSTVRTANDGTYKYEYKVSGGNATITKFCGPLDPVDLDGNVANPDLYYINIPSELNGHPVTGLGAYSFTGEPFSSDLYKFNRKIRSVTIPEGVTSIGGHAFEECFDLENVTIPQSVTSIGSVAFLGCHKIKTLSLGENIETIGGGAFFRCSSLSNITIPEKVTKIEAGSSGLPSFYGTFAYCSGLKYIILPAGLKYFEARLDDCPECVIYYNNARAKAGELLKNNYKLNYAVENGHQLLCLCHVTFDAKGGKTRYDKVPVYETEKITETLANDLKATDLDAINHPTRTGYNFIGWYTTPDGKPEDGKFDVDNTAITKDITLYARWEFDPNALDCHQLTVTGGTVTVKYDDNDVTNTLTVTPDEATGKKTYSVPEGATVTVTLDKNLIPKGNVFDGWSTGEFSLPQDQNCKAENITFTMNSDVDIAAQYRDAATDHTTVTIEGLENAVIKEGESKDFTVKVTPNDDAKLGEAFIDFGDKNGEIEYKDKESGEYKSMLEGGPKINLGNGETEYEFRITPKETGKQTLTAAVKQGENKLAKDEKDFVVSEMPILTLKDGVITSVTVPGKDGADPEDITEIVKKNANEDGSFHVPEGATVSVAFDKDAFADSGLKFGHWDITGLDDPNAYQDKESFAFEMPAKAVTLKAMTQDASIEDDEPDIVGPIVIGTTVVVGGAVLGYQAYSLGAEFAGKLMALPYFPSNRSALAMMLWEDAGKPMPESELLYPDVGQEERDMDLQHAARWAMENELIPDLNDEGTAPEEMKFYPDNTVSKIDVLNAWQKAQELKQNA